MPEFIITPSQLESELSSVKLLDVREPEEWAESRIDGAKHIPLGEIMRRSNELNQDDNIVIYCAHGVRSMHALMALRKLGFGHLRSLQGGIVAWEETHNSTRR